MAPLTLESFVRDLPNSVRKILGQMLDPGDYWEDLVGIIPKTPDMLFQDEYDNYRYTFTSVMNIKSHSNKTEHLLKDWGRQNCKIKHLIKALLRAKLIAPAIYLQEKVLKLPSELYMQHSSTPSDDSVAAAVVLENIHISSPEIKERSPVETTSVPQRTKCPLVAASPPAQPTDRDEALPSFDYKYLQRISDNFNTADVSQGGRLLGQGGFGDVFLGVVSDTHLNVAIKRLNHDTVENRKQFRTEVETMCIYRHEHLVNLLGFCSDGPLQCLVYEYMANGSLEDRLSCKDGTKPLSVATRLCIARGTAKGIAFLHSKGVTHRDIKSANILLDADFKPKVGDFATAKVAPSGRTTKVNSASSVIGTQPYLAPEAFDFKFHTGLDVFSFGVVLLELITALPVLDENRDETDLKIFVEDYCDPEDGGDSGDIYDLRDKKVPEEWSRSLVLNLHALSEKCLVRDRKNRINIKAVLEELEKV